MAGQYHGFQIPTVPAHTPTNVSHGFWEDDALDAGVAERKGANIGNDTNAFCIQIDLGDLGFCNYTCQQLGQLGGNLERSQAGAVEGVCTDKLHILAKGHFLQRYIHKGSTANAYHTVRNDDFGDISAIESLVANVLEAVIEPDGFHACAFKHIVTDG